MTEFSGIITALVAYNTLILSLSLSLCIRSPSPIQSCLLYWQILTAPKLRNRYKAARLVNHQIAGHLNMIIITPSRLSQTSQLTVNGLHCLIDRMRPEIRWQINFTISCGVHLASRDRWLCAARDWRSSQFTECSNRMAIP